jgi:hypothetical protein
MVVHGFRSSQAFDAKPLVNPALVEHARERAQSVENRIAVRITAFPAGPA